MVVDLPIVHCAPLALPGVETRHELAAQVASPRYSLQ